MLIPLSKAGDFGCHVVRAWPPDTPEKTPSRMCAGRKCSSWVVVFAAGAVAYSHPVNGGNRRYLASEEIGVCGLLPRSAAGDTDVARMELEQRLQEFLKAGVLTFKDAPRGGGTILHPQNPI